MIGAAFPRCMPVRTLTFAPPTLLAWEHVKRAGKDEPVHYKQCPRVCHAAWSVIILENQVIYGNIIRVALSISACALLSSCYLVPASFRASLNIRLDSSFTYRYVGDIAYALPSKAIEIRDDASAKCSAADGKPEICSSTQLKQQRDVFEQAQLAQRKNIDELADLIGFNAAADLIEKKLEKCLL